MDRARLLRLTVCIVRPWAIVKHHMTSAHFLCDTCFPTFLSAARGKLVGCYYEGSLNEFIANTTMEINPENCTRFCRDIGYRYAAVQSSKAECACGNVYADDTALFQSCSTRCGDNNYPCGGLDAQSVYFSGGLS